MMNELLYSEWLVLKSLQDKTMTLNELYQETGLDKGLLVGVIQNLIKMKRVYAARGIFRANMKVGENPRHQNWGNSLVRMINHTYRISLKDSLPTSA